MTLRSNGCPPSRADHIGSLLRPPALRQAFRRHAAREIGDEEFGRIQDECIRGVVRLQQQIGLDVVTDGEFRRGSYWGRFVERTEGFEIRGAEFKFRNDQGQEVEFTAPYANAKIRRARPLALDEFVFLRDAAQATPDATPNTVPKITLPAPSTMHFFRCTDFADRSIYSSVEAFSADLATVFEREIKELAAAGCRYVQLDEVAVALLCDPVIRGQVERAGAAPDKLVDLYIDGINRAVAACPPGVVVGVHMCRGNFKGHYLAAGGYERVAEQFFTRTKANHFLLEYDTQRAGDFKPLRFIRDKGVVLGLISSKSPVVEQIEMLEGRVREASRHIDLGRLAISPQCGFASTAAGNPLTEDIEYAKLHLAVRVAERIWEQP
jgi:5-methyltetrahydropteroyltriglutamate--homocysteine methyltransferase